MSQISPSLAQYLMKQGVPAHGFGSFVGSIGNSIGNAVGSLNGGVGSILSGAINPLGGAIGSIKGAFGANNSFQAQDPGYAAHITQMRNQQNDVYQQQQSLAQSLLAQAQGQGPNPAQTMLNQQTAQNVSQQAALMNSQRGASANPGMIARQAAMQGGAIQQQAAGQGATLAAQQQLGAQQALAQQQAQMASQALSGQGMSVQGLGGVNQVGANVAGQNAQIGAGLLGGLLNAAGSGMGMMADGGEVSPWIDPYASLGGSGQEMASSGKGKGLGDALKKRESALESRRQQMPMDLNHPIYAQHDQMLMAAGGGAVPTSYLQGGAVPGQAQYQGDTTKNDTHLALLSPGEMVIPRSIAQHPDAAMKAAEFVNSLKSQKKQAGGYGGVIQSRKSLKSRVEALEKMAAGGLVRGKRR